MSALNGRSLVPSSRCLAAQAIEEGLNEVAKSRPNRDKLTVCTASSCSSVRRTSSYLISKSEAAARVTAKLVTTGRLSNRSGWLQTLRSCMSTFAIFW